MWLENNELVNGNLMFVGFGKSANQGVRLEGG
jgi:hypothetical protein